MWKGCPESEADTLADRALDRVAAKIAQGEKIRSMNAYACEVLRFVWLEHLRQRRETIAVGGEMPENAVAPDIEILRDPDLRLRCLRKCLAAYGMADKLGSYTIKLTELRQATVLDEASRYYDEGKKLFEKGTTEDLRKSSLKFEQARNLYGQSINKFTKLKKAEIFDWQGKIHNLLKKKLQAIEYYKKALLIYRDRNFVLTDDKSELELITLLHQFGETDTLEKIGLIYWDLGNKQEALKIFQEKIAVHHSYSDKTQEGRTLKRIGLLYYDDGDKTKAIEYYEQALAVFDSIKDDE